MIVASVPSIPYRAPALRVVVRMIAPQVDRLDVYLNGYDEVPPFLTRENVRVDRSQDHGDMADGGVFFRAPEYEEDTFHLTLGDDIIYPADYAVRMIAAVRRYRRKALIGVFGARYPGNVTSPLGSGRVLYHHVKELAKDTPVNVIGTATMAYHLSTFRFDLDTFPRRRMPDVGVAVAAQRAELPMVAIARQAAWLENHPLGLDPRSLYRTMKKDPKFWEERADHLRSCNPWKTFLVEK